MSDYVIKKFKEGEVHVGTYGGTIHNVCGWFFEETDEFRPLASDAMNDLFEAGLITTSHVANTAIAYKIHMEKTLTEYAESQERFWNDPKYADARREQEFEMRAAFGPGETVVNVFTGRRHKL